MPRPLRLHVPGALYYLSASAMPGTSLFQTPRDYETYLSLLAEYQGRYGFKVFAYALLSDQVHMLLELSGHATISTVMHAITSRYTKYAHPQHGTSGHLFQARFRSTVIEKAPWLLRLTGYVHRLPAFLGLTAQWQTYPWSSLGRYLAAGDSSIGPSLRGEVQEVLERLKAEAPGLTYLQAIEQTPTASWDAVSECLRQPVVGSDLFIARAQAPHVRVDSQRASGKDPVEPGRGQLVNRQPTLLVTASLAVAGLAVAVSVLAMRGMDAFKRTVQAMGQERLVVIAQAPSASVQPAAGIVFAPERGLEGTAWRVRISPIASWSGMRSQDDQLEFRGGNMVSRSTQPDDAPTYRVLPQLDGGVVWETIEPRTTGEVAYWRGELRGNIMRGTITRQSPGKEAVTFSFVGSRIAESGDAPREL